MMHDQRTEARVNRELCFGIDIGSIACKIVITEPDGTIVDSSYTRTFGKPLQCAVKQIEWMLEKYRGSHFVLAVGTGTVGKLMCELIGIPTINEVVCQAVAIKRLNPEVRTLIEMGGQDSKLMFLPEGDGTDRPLVDFTMNTNCAAGTGSFLDQQASRMGIRIEDEFSELALRSVNPPTVAGRCSVFAKSDMIHLQQKATPDYDIIMGLCIGLARNLKSNLGRGHEFIRPVAFTGGVAANRGVIRALEEVIELDKGQLFVPEEHAITGAYGAILMQMRLGEATPLPEDALDKLHAYMIEEQTIGYRLEPLKRPEHGYPDNRVWLDELVKQLPNGEKIDGWLGLDVGSISTKIAVIDNEDRVLAKSYLMTAGRPLEAVRQCLAAVGEQVKDRIRIRGAATTGSGRYLTGDFIGADLVINEITAQAHGAATIDPEVDTIFEIGGQDSKYIALDHGVVIDFEMNHACAAGTGSFIEEQAERLEVDIKKDFSDRALGSPAPIRLGERCTVFIESDLIGAQQKGAETDDLIAGLSYSIVTNYINRVVGQRRIGKKIFFQGGTAFNKAVVAAFEAVTGKTITVPPHHEVTGSMGAAKLVRKFMEDSQKAESSFGGFGTANMQYEIRSFICEHCSNACEINEVKLPDRDPLYYGAKCPRYEGNKDQASDWKKIPDLFTERGKMLREYAQIKELAPAGAKKIGIPMALSNHQLLPFWGTFFKALGMDVVLSGASSKKIIHRGVEAVLSTPCFPVKVAHGHVLDLIDKQVDYIWLPSVVSMWNDDPCTDRNQLCPYIQSIPYQIESAIDPESRGVKMLDTPVRFGDGPDILRNCLEPLCKEFGISRRQLREAVSAAEQAQEAFHRACIERGSAAMMEKPNDMRAVVVISRPYNGCDPGVSLDLHDKLRKLGVLPIPMDFLDVLAEDVGDDHVFANMYWKYGQRILRAAKRVQRDERLNAVYLSNFSCGPDSFLISFVKRLMGSKPSLVLEIDEHSADAGVVTRLEAFLESLEHAEDISKGEEKTLYRKKPVSYDHKTVYIPWMGDAAYALRAAFEGCGQPAEVLPMATEETLSLGRRHTTGKECLPCIVTTGDMLKKCREKGFNPDKAAFFMPGGSGPCRFGQYNCYQKVVLQEEGLGEIPVIAPTQDKTFYKDFTAFTTDPTRLAWIGVCAVEIFGKARFATRPYEVEAGETDRVYQQCLDDLCALIATNPSESSVYEFADEAADRFFDIDVDKSVRRPKIGVVGEIYVRSHTFSNQDLVRHLERLGAEVDLASFTEWIYYTNFTRERTSWREKSLKLWLKNKMTAHYQKKMERRLAEKFKDFLPNAIEPEMSEILGPANDYIGDTFEGEACVSVGKMVEYARHGFHGLVNVMPFTCMPSTVVGGIMKQLTEDHGGIPSISIAYDGQKDPSLDTRLEAFVLQADAYRRSHSSSESCQAHAPERRSGSLV